MDTRREGTLASDGAGVLTGLALLILAFYSFPVIPPLFRVTAAILLSLINMIIWNREPPAPPQTPRELAKFAAFAVGFIALNVVADSLLGFLFGARTFLAAFFRLGICALFDCVAIVMAVFVGIPSLIRALVLYYRWGQDW